MKTPRSGRGISHLGRLDRIWIRDPVYYITLCTFRRRKMLACAEVHDLILRELETSAAKYGWSVGRYVVMPEQLHFFCAATSEVESKPIETFIGKFKEWSARMIHREFNLLPPIWQAEFFDHILRSNESHAEKWLYVRDNPVRAGLVTKSEEWPYAGEIEEL